MAPMMVPRLRVASGLSALAAAAALITALGSEWWGGLVPCPLCLLERWPYRVAMVLGALGMLGPRRLIRPALALLLLSVLAAAGLALVHVGVEQHWWPSPLPECAAPRFAGGSIAERLGAMPARPSKACEDPTYLFDWLPLSMAAMNLLFAIVSFVALSIFLWRSRESVE